MDSSTDIHMDKHMGGPPVPKKPTLVTPEEFMVRLGEMVMALLLGEIIHRIILFFEELPHVKERWERQKCTFLNWSPFVTSGTMATSGTCSRQCFPTATIRLVSICIKQSANFSLIRIFQGNLWSIAGCDWVWACLAWELLLLLAGHSDRTFHHISHFLWFLFNIKGMGKKAG